MNTRSRSEGKDSIWRGSTLITNAQSRRSSSQQMLKYIWHRIIFVPKRNRKFCTVLDSDRAIIGLESIWIPLSQTAKCRQYSYFVCQTKPIKSLICAYRMMEHNGAQFDSYDLRGITMWRPLKKPIGLISADSSALPAQRFWSLENNYWFL